MKVQAIRDLLFGIQIVNYGRIKDYTEANKFWDADEYDEIYQKLVLEFSELILPKSLENEKFLAVLNFLNEFPMKNVRKYFEIDFYIHDGFKEIYQFYYTPNTPKDLRISKETSGITIDVSTKTIILFPMERIFPGGLFHSDRIDWNSATYSEFIAGEKIFFYHHNDLWYVSSKGHCSLALYKEKWIKHKNSLIFDEFNQYWNSNHMKIFDDKFKNYCFTFMFYSTKIHGIGIEKYEKDRFVLVSCRNMENLKELEIENIDGFDKISSHKCISFGQVLKESYHLNPIKQKGYIIKDANFNRIKLISPQYTALTSLITNPNQSSNREFLEIICRNTNEEFLNYHQNLTENYNHVKSLYQKVCETIQQEFDKIKNFDKKTFTQQCSNSKYKLVFQKMKNMEIENVSDYFFMVPLNDKHFQ